MNKARTRKLRFVGFAESECRAGRIKKRELERLKEIRVPAFYELNLIELVRWKRGEYPFAPMGSTRRHKR